MCKILKISTFWMLFIYLVHLAAVMADTAGADVKNFIKNVSSSNTTLVTGTPPYETSQGSLQRTGGDHHQPEEKDKDLTEMAAQSPRAPRHVYYSPNLIYLQKVTPEGGHCITTGGMAGLCVTFDSCAQSLRYKRQLAILALREWPPVAMLNSDACALYDRQGQVKVGVCCVSVPSVGVVPSVLAIPPPNVLWPASSGRPPVPFPSTEQPEKGEPETMDSEREDNFNTEVVDALVTLSPTVASSNHSVVGETGEINIGRYDLLKEDEGNLVRPVVYDDVRYQWPVQVVGLSGVQQWPPPLPTHPPLGMWPPAIPTHPPDHSYPTHPPTIDQGSTSKPLSSPTPTATKRPPSTTKRPTYPNFPSYPSFPIYPTYRPTPTTTTTTTTTTTSTASVTTQRPSTPGDGVLSVTGLPLQCGRKSIDIPDQERIVGGVNASPHEFPWIAVLFRAGKQFCGGSLITNNHILTAAHCVARMTSWDVAALTAHLGDYNIRTEYEVKHVTRRIKRLVRHKGFDFSTLHNDIAILTLDQPVKFTQEVQPICLPTSPEQQKSTYSGQVATVAGWGSLRENGPQPAILQKVQVPIWTNYDCARKYGHAAPGGIIASMVCAGQAARDSCSGDSGGPLIVNDNGRYVQVGIVSWGIGCGKGQYPGVYTRVTSLLPWIYKNIK